MHYFISAIFLFVLFYSFIKKKDNFLFVIICQGIFLDIFSIQYGGNISALKLAGLGVFLISTKERMKHPSKMFKLLITILVILLINLLIYTLIFPWQSDFPIFTFKFNVLKGIKQLFTNVSEIGCILFISSYILKNGLKELKVFYFVAIIFAIGLLTELIFSIDLFSLLTNGTKLLLPDRSRGFTFEPRAASYYSAILILSCLLVNINLYLKVTGILIFSFCLFLSNSMTGIIILSVGFGIIFLVSIALRAKHLNYLLTASGITIFILTCFAQTNYSEKLKNRFNERSYLFQSKVITEKLEFADSAALNFFIKKPKNLIFGAGTGQAPVATSHYLPKSKVFQFKNGLTYLPFMGIMLILTNGGLLLLLLYMLIIIYGLREILKMKVDKATRDQLFTFTCLFIGTYFLQVRYFHILGYVFMLYAEMYNRKYGYREIKFFDNSRLSLRNKTLSNAKHLLSEKVIRLIGNFAVSIFIANLLGPEKYGNYAFILSFVYIFLPLVDFGVSEFIIKDLTDSKNQSSIISSAFKFRFFSAIGMISISIISYTIIFYNDLSQLLYIAIFSVSFLFRSMDVAYHLFQAQLKNHIITQLNNVVFIVLFVAKIIAVYLSQDIIVFIYISAFENILQGILYFYALRKEKYYIDFKENSYQVSKYVKAGIPILISTVIGSLYLRMDQIFIQKFLTPKELGIYALAVKFINVTTFIPQSIAVIGFPLLIKNNNDESIKKYFNIGSIISIVTTIGIITVFPFILGLTISPAYSDSTEILSKLSLIIFPMFFNIINLKILIIQNKIGFILKQNFMILIINIFLNYIFIEKYRLDGVITATLSSYLITYTLFSIFSKDFRLFFMSYIIPNPKRVYRLMKDIK